MIKLSNTSKIYKTLGIVTFVMFLSAVLISPPLYAAVDFKGKTVEWIIPFSAGGGSDKWARFYAPLLSDALPGKPNVIVKNMPGGGSTIGANFFAARAKANGLTIFGTSGSTQFPFLLNDPRVKYDYKDWKIVLGTPTGGVVYVSSSLNVRSAKDLGKLKGVNMKYGSQGATSLDLIPLLAFEIMGLDVDAVMGMKGRGEGLLAFQRGEVTIDYQTTSAYLKNVVPLVKEGSAVPIFAYGTLDSKGNLQRDPTFPDLPHFAEAYEMMHGKKPSGQAYKAWMTFFAAGFAAQKMIFLPKKTPSAVVRAYQKAVEKVVNDPGFAQKGEQRLGKYPQATGRSATTMKKVATSVSKSSKRWVINWLNSKYNTNLSAD